MASRGAKLLPTISTRRQRIKNEATAISSLEQSLLELPNHRAFTKSLLNQPIAAKSIVNHINNIAYYNM
jgi:hypothetical protein